MYTNPEANINSKMVTDADQGSAMLRDGDIVNREIVLEKASLYSITDENQQDLIVQFQKRKGKRSAFIGR